MSASFANMILQELSDSPVPCAYGVITKTTDNNKLDESEEVYEYILCAICPVELTKAGLGYHKDKNVIAPRIRDWVVSVPETGFLFPAFSDRSSDVNAMGYYVKDAKRRSLRSCRRFWAVKQSAPSPRKKRPSMAF